MAEYILTLNSEQAKTLLKAADLFNRIKIGQYKDIIETVLPASLTLAEFCNRRDVAEPWLERAFTTLQPNGTNKDDEWYRTYNIIQSLRYAMHECEYPEVKYTVDAYPPIQFTEEPIPKCEWRKTDETTK